MVVRGGAGDRRNRVHRRVGTAVAFAMVLLFALPSLATAASRPALHFDDGLDWGFTQAADLTFPDAGDTLRTTLRVGNGVPGATGYQRSTTDPKQTPSGISTSLLGAVQQGPDDGAAAVELPFSFPYHGVRYRNVSVSTNGWVSFGAPAFDYYPDSQTADYRGVRGVVGNFYRGVMPYWTDLDLANCGGGAGALDQVVPKDESAVAFVWNVDHHCAPPRRAFEVVLFRDGRIRFDYFGANTASSQDTIVGISGGTGRSSFDALETTTHVMPSNSILYKPETAGASDSDKTEASVTLQRGSSFVASESSGSCEVAKAPSPGRPGVARCGIPALDPGQSVSRSVAFVIPSGAAFDLGTTAPNLDLLASMSEGGDRFTDAEESTFAEAGMDEVPLDLDATYIGPGSPTVGDQLNYEVTLNATDGLHKPRVIFRWPSGTRYVDSTLPSCAEPDQLGGPGSVSCPEPSGYTSYGAGFTIKATSQGAKTVTLVGKTKNTPTDTDTASSPIVLP